MVKCSNCARIAQFLVLAYEHFVGQLVSWHQYCTRPRESLLVNDGRFSICANRVLMHALTRPLPWQQIKEPSHNCWSRLKKVRRFCSNDVTSRLCVPCRTMCWHAAKFLQQIRSNLDPCITFSLQSRPIAA